MTNPIELSSIKGMKKTIAVLVAITFLGSSLWAALEMKSIPTEELSLGEEGASSQFFCTESANRPDHDRGDVIRASLESDKASMAVINYTSCPTDSIVSWSLAASDRMASRKSNILTFLYPVGMPTGEQDESLPGGPGLHEVVMSTDEQEKLTGQIKQWMNANKCEGESEIQLEEFRMLAQFIKKGADASTMRALCPNVRVVAMGITPQMLTEGKLGLKYFLLHELYHGFQQDLSQEGECRAISEDRATANTPWMVEGGAHYFASFLTGVVREEGLVSSGEAREDQRIRMEMLRDALRFYEEETQELHESGPDIKGAAALLLMIDKGLITHEEIMDGSFFTDCNREFLYPASSQKIQDIRNSWYQIVGTNGRYEFRN